MPTLARSRLLLALGAIAAPCASVRAAPVQFARPPAIEGDWDSVRTYAVRARPDGSRYVADELLIGLRPDAERSAVLAAVGARGARLLGEIGGLRVLRVELPQGEDPLRAVASFAAIAGVAYAEPNGVGEGGVLLASNDRYFPLQWHHENTGQSGGLVGADIETPAAWALATNPSPVVLAILDTGIDFSHPEFMGRVVPGWDYVNEDADATADHPHGIACAGLAAANVGNSFAVAGVDPSCTIYPIKVLDSSNGGTVSDLVQGLNLCAAQHVDVVSMSLINYGGTTLENALVAARNAGCILVACAGNGGIGDADVSGPGSSAQTISIGATNRLDQRASFSGTGTQLDFVAPGESVVTVSTTHNNSWSGFSGCSAATPVAAGIVALLLGQNPALTQPQVVALLKAGAEDQVGLPAEDTPGRDDFMGWGRLNARASVQQLASCPFPSTYGTGKVTSTGTLPQLGYSGLPWVSTSNFVVRLGGALPGNLAVAFYGAAPASIPWQAATLLAAPPLVRLPALNLDPNGTGNWPIAVDAGMIGTQRCFQAWFRDPAQADGTSVGVSNALSATFCP